MKRVEGAHIGPDPEVNPVRTSLRLALALLLALTVVSPATAEEPDCYAHDYDEDGEPIGPLFCTLQTWFRDSGTKAGNAAGAGATSFPTWGTEAPATSVTGGAGGGYFGNGALWQTQGDRNPALAPTFEGTFTGNIDNLAITMYLFAPGRQTESTIHLDARLVVDGEEVGVFGSADLPLVAGGDAVLRTSFVLTNIHAALSFLGFDDDDEAEHDITLQVNPYPLATSTAILVYDTTEVPSSMVFNQQDLDGWYVLQVW